MYTINAPLLLLSKGEKQLEFCRWLLKDAIGMLSHFDVTPTGAVRPHRETVVVGGRRGGYGFGVEVQRDSTGRPLPGRPVQLTGQDANAWVILQYNLLTDQWDVVTQYPTNAPVTL